jgi:hypothetical protein
MKRLPRKMLYKKLVSRYSRDWLFFGDSNSEK